MPKSGFSRHLTFVTNPLFGNFIGKQKLSMQIDLSTVGDKPRPPWLLLRPPTLLVNIMAAVRCFEMMRSMIW